MRLSSVSRTAKAATLAGLLSLPLLGALVYAVWPPEIWHGGPNSPIVDADARLQSLQRQESQLASAAETDTQAPATISRNLRVASGDTLMEMLTDAGVARQEAYEAITALSDVFSPRSLRPGQEIRLDLAADTSDAEPRLLALNLQPDVERNVRVIRSESNEFIAEAIARPLQETIERAVGTIKTNLSADAVAAGVPTPVLIQLIRIFSFDVDFQRDIQPGDQFEVL